MLKSEKKSLIRFLLIYLGSTFLLFSIASWIFYTSQKHHLLDKQRDALKFESAQIISTLRTLHKTYTATLAYPVDPFIKSAIYDLNKTYIFGTDKPRKLLTQESYMAIESKLYYLSKVEPYYIGAAFLLLSKGLEMKPILELQRNIAWFLLGAGIFFALLGLFLGRLFIAPMRESIEKMNHFIQDATHELNTPISIILTNIKMLETFGKCEKSDEFKRIEIASKTLSLIYEDLTYLSLNHNYYRHIEAMNISRFIEERMIYFSVMAEQKYLKVAIEIEPNIVLNIDKNDATRLVDNLITNAIKYNKTQGLLMVKVSKDTLRVIDTGSGIEKKELDTIVCRFKRANKSEGGFGIGLDIVSQVVARYGYILDIQSEVRKGTEVVVQWGK